MKHITIKDIAKELSLSVSTVSRAIQNDKNIRRETKELVLEAVERMGYKPNPVALNLKYGRSNTIGVIVPEMITPFASLVIEGIQAVLYAKGYKVMIAQSNEDPKLEKENLLMMERFMVDGIIVCVSHHSANSEDYRRIQKSGTPIVFYDRIPEDDSASKVIVNDYIKSFFMTEHLIKIGCRKIAHLRAPDYVLNSIDRFKGYRDCLEKYKIPYNKDLVIQTGMTIEDGSKAVEKLFRDNIVLDGLFAFTDTLAIGAMMFLRQNNIRIPQDVAVAGFSGTVLSTIVYPQLTTVEQPHQQMGQAAAELILEKIKDPMASNKTIVLDAEIIIRHSTDANL